MPALLILIPLIAVMVINIFFKRLMRNAAFWFLAGFLILQFCFAIKPGSCEWISALSPLAQYFTFTLAVDQIGSVMLIAIALVIFITLFVARHFIRDDDQLFNFINLLFVLLMGLNGVVMVRDIFTLYVFLEVIGVSSFVLICFNKERDAFEGAFKYIIFSAVAAVMMLSSIALIYLVAGGTSYPIIQKALVYSPHSTIVTIAMGIFLVALFIKSGLVPFHGWLPDVYSSAPAAVSVLLGGIVTKTVGVYALIRLVLSVFIFSSGISNILMFVGAFSICFGALAALGQSNFKRMLAYSSISQVGYIILSLGCGTALGIFGAMFHLFNHSVFKSLLFVNSACLESQAGTLNMHKMGRLSSRMPVTAFSSLVAGLSTAGIPPFAGFWSKFIIIFALFSSGHIVYAVIAILASVITLGYILAMQRMVFWGKAAHEWEHEDIREAGLGLLIPTIILTLITIAVGIFAPVIFKLLK